MSRKKVNPNQLSLFPIKVEKPKEKTKSLFTGKPRVQRGKYDFLSVKAKEKKMIIEFAKRFKNSFAFEDCVEFGWLDENYHTNLADKTWVFFGKGNAPKIFIPKVNRLAYFERKGYQIIETHNQIMIIDKHLQTN